MTIQLHPGSLFAGLGLAVLAFIAMGQQSMTSSPPRTGLDSVLMRPPAAAPVQPKDWFSIVEGQPFVVPAGKLLVIRAIGADRFIGACEVHVDGIRELEVTNNSANTSMFEVPRLFVVASGSTVDLIHISGSLGLDIRAWCYLADA